VIALLLGVLLAFLRERLDLRIRSPHELEELTGLPLLTSLPESAFPDQAPSSAEGEAFQTLRASLTYYNVDRPLRTIIVASPQKGDGKTTVATNLAVSLARGGKDVILVDADLRRPQVASRLGVTAETGLAAVLSDQATADETLIDVHVVTDGTLRVLPAGPPPPNPSELLSSDRARALILELGQKADIVVIDSTPILPVSDVLPLLREATGVVAVSKLGKTNRESMRRFLEVVTMAGGTVLGLVATNARAGGLYDGYGYGYGGYEPYKADASSSNGEGRPATDRSPTKSS
jgi:capsular exopolysaccharide synthesis family protein